MRAPESPTNEMVRRVLASPPQVHALDGEAAPTRIGVWRSEDSIYELLVDTVKVGDRTLETGLGISTALFAALGAEHRCVVSRQPEADRLLAYCGAEGIPTDRLTIDVGFSDEVLPPLDVGVLDVVFIDGGHGFPTPIVDWHYGARALRIGGLLVLDDVSLPAVHVLRRFLDVDPHWQRVRITHQWAAYRRVEDTATAEDWWEQPWVPMPFSTRARAIAERIRRRVPGRLRRLRSGGASSMSLK